MIVLIQPVLGVDSLGYFKMNECVNLVQTCADCSYVNFTGVIAPNGVRVLNNTATTKDGTIFNYNFCDTKIAGIYIVHGMGDPGATNQLFVYDFTVNTAGKKIDSIGSLPVTIFMLFITIGVFALLKLVDRFSEDDIMEVVFRGAIILFGLFMTTILISMIITITIDMGIGVDSELFTILFILTRVLYLIMVFVVLKFLFMVLKLYKTKRENERMGYA